MIKTSFLVAAIFFVMGCANVRWTEQHQSDDYKIDNDVVTSNIITRSGYSKNAIYDCLPIVKLHWNHNEYIVHEGWITELQIVISNDGCKLLVIEKMPVAEDGNLYIKFGEQHIQIKSGKSTYVFKCIIDKESGTIMKMADLANGRLANVTDVIFEGLPQKFYYDGNAHRFNISSYRAIR